MKSKRHQEARKKHCTHSQAHWATLAEQCNHKNSTDVTSNNKNKVIVKSFNGVKLYGYEM